MYPQDVAQKAVASAAAQTAYGSLGNGAPSAPRDIPPSVATVERVAQHLQHTFTLLNRLEAAEERLGAFAQAPQEGGGEVAPNPGGHLHGKMQMLEMAASALSERLETLVCRLEAFI